MPKNYQNGQKLLIITKMPEMAKNCQIIAKIPKKAQNY